MKDKDYWLVEWRRENERKRVLAEIMGVANATRQIVLRGENRILGVLDSVEYYHDGAEVLIEFAILFAHGDTISTIAETMQLPESAIKAISDNKLLRW